MAVNTDEASLASRRLTSCCAVWFLLLYQYVAQEFGIPALVHCWWKCRFVVPLQKTVWRFLKKLKMELPYDLAVLILGIYLKKYKTLSKIYICTSLFISDNFSTFQDGQGLETGVWSSGNNVNKASLALQPCTCCCVAQFLTGHGPC